MACLCRYNSTISLVDEAHSSSCSLDASPSSSFHRARRSALVPSDCFLPTREATEERMQDQQQLPPGPALSLPQSLSPEEKMRKSPQGSERPEKCQTKGPLVASCREQDRQAKLNIPPAARRPTSVARDPRIRSAKARAQYARDRNRRSSTPDKRDIHTGAALPSAEIVRLPGVGPKRMLPAFVKEEEFQLHLEDRASTPHPSELFPEEDAISSVDAAELTVRGKVAALEGSEGR